MCTPDWLPVVVMAAPPLVRDKLKVFAAALTTKYFVPATKPVGKAPVVDR